MFHATKTEINLKSILSSKSISEHPGGEKGPGAYLSTNDEYYNFGEFTFALDLESLSNLHANWYSKTSVDAIWIHVEGNVHVGKDSLAYVVLPDGENYDPMKRELAQQYPWLISVDRSVSNLIRNTINTVSIRQLPKGWKRIGHLEELPKGIKS